jgi:hypothetical protein
MVVWDFTCTLWDDWNDVLHNSDVHDKLLDMAAANFEIIEEEWHAARRRGVDLNGSDAVQRTGVGYTACQTQTLPLRLVIFCLSSRKNSDPHSSGRC